jgi:hypothetical protein
VRCEKEVVTYPGRLPEAPGRAPLGATGIELEIRAQPASREEESLGTALREEREDARRALARECRASHSKRSIRTIALGTRSAPRKTEKLVSLDVDLHERDLRDSARHVVGRTVSHSTSPRSPPAPAPGSSEAPGETPGPGCAASRGRCGRTRPPRRRRRSPSRGRGPTRGGTPPARAAARPQPPGPPSPPRAASSTCTNPCSRRRRPRRLPREARAGARRSRRAGRRYRALSAR